MCPLSCRQFRLKKWMKQIFQQRKGPQPVAISRCPFKKAKYDIFNPNMFNTHYNLSLQLIYFFLSFFSKPPTFSRRKARHSKTDKQQSESNPPPFRNSHSHKKKIQTYKMIKCIFFFSYRPLSCLLLEPQLPFWYVSNQTIENNSLNMEL